MIRTMRAALAAIALALGCAGALAQSAFPTPGGSYVDGHALMCPNGSTDFQGRPVMVPCSSSTPLQIAGSFTASLGGFQPTPAYSQLAVGATSARAVLPSGAVIIVYNTGANAASVTLGNASVVATGANDIIPAGGWIAFTVGPNVDLAAIEATGAAGTTSLVISGGSGLPTGAGAGGGGGGSGSNASVGATAAAAPGSATYDGMLVNGGNMVGASGSVWGSAPTGLNVLGVNADIVASALPAGAATAANQEVTAAGTSASSAQAVQGVTGGVPQAVSTAVNVTPTDCSQTANGASQTLITANAAIHGFTIVNIDPTTGGGEPIWISFTGAAVVGAKASYPLPAPIATTYSGEGSYTTPPGFGSNQNVTEIATTGHLISCHRW